MRPARSLGRVLSTRLALTALIGLGLLAAALAWLDATHRARGLDRVAADMAAHFESRTRLIDAEWVRQADVLRGQIEFSGVLDVAEAGLADARLTAYLASMGGQGAFTHVLLLDAAGSPVYRYGTRTQWQPAPGARQPLGWAFSEADRLAYRVLRSSIRLGPRGGGEIVMFAPVDNALLAANTYPDTSLRLAWGERRDLAFSGDIARAGDDAAPAPDVDGSIAWGGEADAPELRYTRRYVADLPLSELLAVVIGGVALGAALGWLLLGRWVRDHVRQISVLAGAAREFSAAGALLPATATQLDRAENDASAELRDLARDLRTLVTETSVATAAQRAAQDRLHDLNATLEARVDERTHDLASARDAALAAVRAKEQFLAGMSHELRTPLLGLLGGLELIEDGGLPEHQQRLLRVARKSGEALRDVINDVLDFSKLDSGRIDLAQRGFRVDQLATEAVALFAAVALRKGLSLTCDCAKASEAPVLGDPARLRQVLLNLLGNAVKFTDRGGVALRVESINGTHGDRVRLRFTVEDSGIGIDDALARQLFQPFVQADPTLNSARGGSGLGLAISQRLVGAMGGRIEVHSAPGAGSRFSFELTLARTAWGERPAAPADTPARLHGRVLLVEDNPVNRVIAVAMLQRLGLSVVEAGNGLEAIAALRNAPFDLVLMDNNMPLLDGLEATRRLRAGAAGARAAALPIVAVTASALGTDSERCLDAGMNAHLSKPYTQIELAAAIEPWLSAVMPAASPLRPA